MDSVSRGCASWFFSALLCLSGCGGSTPEEGGLALSNGVRVHLSGAGGFELTREERSLLALADGVGPRARTFVEERSSVMGIWNVLRRDEESFPLEPVEGQTSSSEAVVLRYQSADGEWSGAVTITVAGAEATRVRFALDEGAPRASSLSLPLRCDPEGSFHGFGEQYNATDQRGEAFQLIVSEQGIGRDGALRYITGDAHTTYFPMPWYLDARGFGVLVETGHPVDVDLCATDSEVAWLEVIADEPVELLLFHGPTPLEVLRQLGDHLGRPAAPPAWAYGLWVAVQGGPEVVLDAVDLLEGRGVPFSAIWSQDWTGARENADGGYGVQYRWAADDELYPDLLGLVDELHGRGYRFLAYANPFVDEALEDHFPEMDARGLLIGDPEGGGSYLFPAPNGRSSHPDFTNPDACDYVQSALRAMVVDYGIDGWMADFGEYTPLDAVLHDGSDPMVFHNRFPIEWQRMTRAVMDEERPDGDWVMFARSGWTGVQSVAQIHWAGDQEASWSETDGLPTVVPALLNLGLSGQPYVTHDIGGFSGGPSTKELYLRWIELGALTPIMRTHQGNNRDENWSWDSDGETSSHLARFARVHEALSPELQALAAEAQRSSAPILRHLMLVFPDDREVWSISDQFMIGDELLAAPVVHPGVTRREVYLPRGSWYHVWSGEVFEGGQVLWVEAPIGSPPLFSLGRDREDLRAIR